MSKPFVELTEREVNRLLSGIARRVTRKLPDDAAYILFLVGKGVDERGDRVVTLTNCDKLVMIKALRDEADDLERELIESN